MKCSPKGLQYKIMIYFDYLVTIIHVVTFDESSSLDIVQDFMFIGAS